MAAFFGSNGAGGAPPPTEEVVEEPPANLHVLAADGDIDEVQRVVRAQATPQVRVALVNAQDENGYSPLAAAAEYGHIEVVRYLIEEGASCAISDGDGDTPLHVCNSVDVARILIENGADENATNADGLTPLQKFIVELEEEENLTGAAWEGESKDIDEDPSNPQEISISSLAAIVNNMSIDDGPLATAPREKKESSAAESDLSPVTEDILRLRALVNFLTERGTSVVSGENSGETQTA